MERVELDRRKETVASGPKKRFVPAAKQVTYWCVVVAAAILLILVNRVTAMAPVYHEANTHESFLHIIDNNQYAYQARSLAEGHAYLDLDVDERLASLENPYDYSARHQIAQEHGAAIYWDYAFYDGRYYCYFGVVPAAIVYLPYLLITNSDLSTPDAILLLAILVCIACSTLIKSFASLLFDRQPSLFVQISGFVMLLLSSNVAFLALSGRFYSVPLLSSLACTFFGLTFWVKAKQAYQERSRGQDAKKSPILFLGLGTFLMTLNYGCRPQFLVACLLALPIFWEEIAHKRLLFSKKGFKPTIAIVFAILVAVIPICLFNYVRFGSPLDNGSFYNLTGFDMSAYMQSKKTTLSILYYYLIQPLNFENNFPWVSNTDMDFTAQWAPNEPMYGGIFALLPFLFALLLTPFVENNRFPLFRVIAIGASITVLVVDARVAGVTRRYFTDFTYLLSLVAIFNIWQCIKAPQFGKHDIKQGLTKAGTCLTYVTVSVLLGYSLLICTLITFSPHQYDSIAELNPALFATVSSFF